MCMICCCNVGLRIIIALVAVMMIMVARVCGDGGVIIVAACATTIRNKTSTHALDINRIVKSETVIAATDRILLYIEKKRVKKSI